MRCRVLGSRASLVNCDLVREQRLTISFRSLVPNPAVASLIASASSLAMYCFRSRLCCCSWVAHSASEEASSAASLRARIIDSMNADMLVISHACCLLLERKDAVTEKATRPRGGDNLLQNLAESISRNPLKTLRRRVAEI